MNIKNSPFFKKAKPTILIALVFMVAPIGYTFYLMEDYDYSSMSARTDSMTSRIEIEADGDALFTESRQRYLDYAVIEQQLYFTADDEDVAKTEHTPQFDTTAFSNSVTDTDGTLLIQGDGTTAVESLDASKYLTYSWLPNPVNELGDPFYALDNESINLLHYNSEKWGNAIFNYDYKINGVALKYADTSEFFWTVATTDYMKTTDVEVTIVLPTTSIETSDVKVYLKGAAQGKVASITKNAGNQIEIKLTAGRLYPGEFLSTRINFPTSALTITPGQDALYGNLVDDIPHLENVATYEAEYLLPRTIYRIADISVFIVGFLLILFGISRAISIYKKYDKEHESAFYGEYYRELPAEYGPALMGYLYNFKDVNKEDVAATLMDLIRRKFITIDTQGQSLTESKVNYVLRYDRSKDKTELTTFEKELLGWFFDLVAKGDNLTLDQLDNFTKVEARAISYMEANKRFVSAVRREGVSQNFFDDVKTMVTKEAAPLGLLALVGIASLLIGYAGYGTYTLAIGGILLGLSTILGGYFSTIERRSKKGNEDFLRWQAFEKFLKEFSNIKDYPMPGITVWEHYMVYAVAFGIADLVEKQLRFKYKQMGLEDSLQSSPMFRHSGFQYYYASRLSRSFAMAQNTIQVAQAQRNNAAGGGGGRFGGGGGGRIGGGGSGVRLR